MEVNSELYAQTALLLLQEPVTPVEQEVRWVT